MEKRQCTIVFNMSNKYLEKRQCTVVFYVSNENLEKIWKNDSALSFFMEAIKIWKRFGSIKLLEKCQLLEKSQWTSSNKNLEKENTVCL